MTGIVPTLISLLLVGATIAAPKRSIDDPCLVSIGSSYINICPTTDPGTSFCDVYPEVCTTIAKRAIYEPCLLNPLSADCLNLGSNDLCTLYPELCIIAAAKKDINLCALVPSACEIAIVTKRSIIDICQIVPSACVIDVAARRSRADVVYDICQKIPVICRNDAPIIPPTAIPPKK